jgi:hypothetical protein
MPSLLTVGQRPGMDNKYHSVGIDEKNYLNQPPVNPSSDRAPFPVSTILRIRSSRAADDCFGFLHSDAMSSRMLDIPGVPSEFHNLTI